MSDVNKIENTAVNRVDVTENLAAAVAKEIPELNVEEGSSFDRASDMFGKDGTELVVETVLNDPNKILLALESSRMADVKAWNSTAKTVLLQSLAKLGGYPDMKVDGIYKTQTKDFVSGIQSQLEVKMDGYAGENTMPGLIALVRENENNPSVLIGGKASADLNISVGGSASADLSNLA